MSLRGALAAAAAGCAEGGGGWRGSSRAAAPPYYHKLTRGFCSSFETYGCRPTFMPRGQRGHRGEGLPSCFFASLLPLASTTPIPSPPITPHSGRLRIAVETWRRMVNSRNPARYADTQTPPLQQRTPPPPPPVNASSTSSFFPPKIPLHSSQVSIKLRDATCTRLGPLSQCQHPSAAYDTTRCRAHPV